MEKKMKTKVRLKMTITLWNKRKRVAKSTKHIKEHIKAHCERVLWDKGLLTVYYKDNQANSAECTNIDEVKKCLSIFTEKSLLIYLMED